MSGGVELLVAGLVVVLGAAAFGMKRDASRRKENRSDSQSAIEGLAAELALRPIVVADPVIAFPPSLRATRNSEKAIRRDQKKRRGAFARGWEGCLNGATPLEIYCADFYGYIQPTASGSDHDDGGQWMLHQLARVRLTDHNPPAMRLIVGADGDFGSVFGDGWYRRDRLLGTSPIKLDLGRRSKHEVHCSRNSDRTAMRALLTPAFVDWLDLVNRSMRFELIDGILDGFEHALRTERLPSVTPLVEATYQLAVFVSSAIDRT